MGDNVSPPQNLKDIVSTVDSVLFDLDGTLWDVTSLVAKARNAAFKQLGIESKEFTREDVAKYIGLPADEIYRRIFPHWTQAEAERARKATGAEIARLLPEGEGVWLYPGVREGLATLKARYRLFIVSNCASGYIENFLKWSDLGDLFEDHECYGNTLKTKGENIASVVGRNSLAAPVYIGDTESDHKAALQARVPYAHVNYGFGTPVGPCPSFDTFEELVGAFHKISG